MKYLFNSVNLVLLLTLLFIARSVKGTAQESLSMSRAIQIGLENNFGIQIQKAETEIAQNQLKHHFKNQLPRIDLVAGQQNGANNSSSPTSFVQGFYGDRGLNGGIDINWTVFQGFKAKITKSRLEKLNKQAQGKTMILVENTIHAIIMTYYDVLIKKEAVKVQRDVTKRSKERYEDAVYQMQHGKASNYDMVRFENAMLIDSTNVIFKKKQMYVAMQNLNTALGNRFFKEYKLTDRIQYRKKSYNFGRLQSKMASLNTRLSNQYLNLYLVRNDIGLLKAERYPKVAISGGLTQNFNSTKFQEIERIRGKNSNFYLNFSASYNLFDGGKISRALQEGQIKERIANLQIEDMKQELSTELQNRISNYNTQLELITLNERVIENLKSNLLLEKDRYQSGFSSLLDYSSLKEEYLKAEQTKLEAIYELLVNETEIIRLTGGLMKYYR